MNKLKSIFLAAIFMVSAGAQAGWLSGDGIKGDRTYELGSVPSSYFLSKEGVQRGDMLYRYSYTDHNIVDKIGVVVSPLTNKILRTVRIKRSSESCRYDFTTVSSILRSKYPKLFRDGITDLPYPSTLSYLKISDGTNTAILACDYVDGKYNFHIVHVIDGYREIYKEDLLEYNKRYY